MSAVLDAYALVALALGEAPATGPTGESHPRLLQRVAGGCQSGIRSSGPTARDDALTKHNDGPDVAITRPGFWARQFTGPYTGGQWLFDLVFGLILPPICFLADPIVFVWDPLISGGFSDLALFVYLASGIAMAFLASWMFLGRHLHTAAALWSGAMGVAAMAASAIGVLLLPLTLIGLLAGIGVLGLTPFGTALAYGRGVHEAWKQAAEHRSRALRSIVALSGALLVVGPPAAADAYVSRLSAHAAMALPTATLHEAASIIARLDAVPWCPASCGRPLVMAFERASDEGVRERLSAGFLALTKRRIEGFLRPSY